MATNNTLKWTMYTQDVDGLRTVTRRKYKTAQTPDFGRVTEMGNTYQRVPGIGPSVRGTIWQGIDDGI